MIQLEPARKYRNDIDGLRGIAVLAVVLFHFGCLPSGFLGVDVFFVISGYLITGIIFNELKDGDFSILNFYIRRIRRIIPLALFLSTIAVSVGALIMLADDMENMAQSVIATNFFTNNILQAITTKNYWDVVNEYKPLMHTWSLGIEEQYYLIYPVLCWLVFFKRPDWLLPALSILTLGSIVLVLAPFQDHHKFYLLPFRFYELSTGGIAAIALKNQLIHHRFFCDINRFTHPAYDCRDSVSFE